MTEAHLCVICPVRGRRPVHYERAQACEPCRIWLAETIADVAALYPQLHALLVPSGTAGQKVTGSREMPLPLNVDILDLTGRAKGFTPSKDAVPEDQVGHTAVAYVLDSWARDWIGYEWCRSDQLPAATVAELAAWLGKWVEAACDHHPAIDDFADEIRDLHAAIRAYIPRMVDQTHSARAERRPAPCPSCDAAGLWWWPSDQRVKCDNCPRSMTIEEYARWVSQKTAYAKHWMPGDPCPFCEQPYGSAEPDGQDERLLRFEPCGHLLRATRQSAAT